MHLSPKVSALLARRFIKFISPGKQPITRKPIYWKFYHGSAKHFSPNTDFYVTETSSLKDDQLNTNSNVLYPISTVTGPDFKKKEIAELESESVLLDENRKCLDINYKPFGKGLVMASLNINSLLAHSYWRIFMSEADIDIISINETFVLQTHHKRS